LVDKFSSVPLYMQIQEALEAQIRSGQLPPGSRVPSELELVAQYNVSRMTARKALDGLVARGQLFRQQGKGTFVAEGVMSYRFSTMLSFSGTLRARGYAVETRVLRQEVIPGPPSVLEKLELRPGSQVVLVRRLRLVEGRPAAIHTAFMDYLVYSPLLQVDLAAASLLESIERVCGVRIAYTRDSVEAGLVSIEDMGLLDVPHGSPVLEVEGVAFTENGQPTRLTRAVYRADLFRLVVVNTADRATALNMAEPAGRQFNTHSN
jgi:GntR family transcriptional regulator